MNAERAVRRFICLSILCADALVAQKFYTYVGDIGPRHVVLAWGTTAGTNTIGRSSASHGRATIKIGEQQLQSEQNWITVNNLNPDTDYSYEVRLNGDVTGKGRIHTWPESAEKLCFFVIGDWGSGDSNQYKLSAAMVKEFESRASGQNPVRFVITTGDNIYGTARFGFSYSSSGNRDRDWGPKFFEPYERILSSIPFYPSLGNHDGNESEDRADLAVYLDNFFFPGGSQARYYRFSFGGLADFFALDSTLNTESGPRVQSYRDGGDQHKWLAKNLAESQVPWKIPYMHHPLFTAGPRHPPASKEMAHFVELFRKHGVKVVFSGHEHNFQMSETNRATGGIRYFVSGAGGELRTGDVRARMEESSIAAWAPQLHFLVVEIEKGEMTVTPKSFENMRILNKSGGEVRPPFKVRLTADR